MIYVRHETAINYSIPHTNTNSQNRNKVSKCLGFECKHQYTLKFNFPYSSMNSDDYSSVSNSTSITSSRHKTIIQCIVLTNKIYKNDQFRGRSNQYI